MRAYTKKLVKIAYCCIWGLNAVLLLLLPLILRIYNLSDAARQYAFLLILIHNGCAMALWPLSFTLPNALRAAGDVKVPMVISMVSMAAVRLVGSWLLGVKLGLGVVGVWIAMVADWVVRTICFLRGCAKLWKEHHEPLGIGRPRALHRRRAAGDGNRARRCDLYCTSGDTLWAIARDTAPPWPPWRPLNRIADPDLIVPGQVLELPA